MKKSIFLILCGYLFFTPVWAQEENETDVKSSIIVDGASYSFIFNWKKKATESHYTGAGFAFSRLENLTETDLNLSRSYSVVLNLMDYVAPISQNWTFVTGLGFDWSRYHFRGNTVLQAIDNNTQFVPDREDRNYRDSKLLVYYATIPFLLEYQTKSFFIYGGIEGLIKCYSKSQAEIKTPDGIQKAVFKDLNLLPLNFHFALRAGFDDFSVFGYYQPCSLFEKGKGPDVNPMGIGIMLNF